MMESNLIMHNQESSVLDILKKSLLVFGGNINFIIFTLVISFPLFCFLVYYEFFFQNFLYVTSEALEQSPDDFYYYRHNAFHIARQLNKQIFYEFVQLGFLYLVLLHLLELFIVLLIVDLASKIYEEDEPMSLKDMIHKPVEMAKLRGTFVTFVYVTLLSTCTLVGLIWLVTTYYVILRTSFYHVLLAPLCGAIFVPFLTLYLALSSEWNMSIVISILEGIYGAEALVLSAYFIRGNHRRGLILMFVFFVWGVNLRLPCLYIGCYKQGYGIVAQISLFCLGNALKWVVCVVYFLDCKKRILGKKVDHEVGIQVKAVDE